MTSIPRVPPIVVHDQVDFFAMVQAIWQQRKVIALSVVLFGMVAGLYAFLATPEYQTSTFLRPAAVNDLDALNRSEIYSLPPERALLRVGASLDSYDTRLKFFLANQSLFEGFGPSGGSQEQNLTISMSRSRCFSQIPRKRIN